MAPLPPGLVMGAASVTSLGRELSDRGTTHWATR